MFRKAIWKFWLPITWAILLALPRPVMAGPYAPKAGEAGSTAVHMDDAAFIGLGHGMGGLQSRDGCLEPMENA